MKQIECRQDAMNRVNEIMSEQIKVKEHGELCLLDLLCETKDTEDVETLSELKTYINGMLDSEITYRLNNQHLKR